MKDGKHLFKRRQIVACDDTIASSMNEARLICGWAVV